MRTATAHERAHELIVERRARLIAADSRTPEEGGRADHPTDRLGQAILHVVPLFPLPGGFALTEQRVVDRLADVPMLGWSNGYSSRRFTLDGLHFNYSEHARAAYLRSGAVEHQDLQIAVRDPRHAAGSPGQTPLVIDGWDIEQRVLLTLDQCAGLTADGLLPLPVVIALSLVGVEGSRLTASPRLSRSSPEVADRGLIAPTTVLVHEWDAVAGEQVRSMFDELYQAWGYQRSPGYDGQERRWFTREGRTPPPAPRYWPGGWTPGP